MSNPLRWFRKNEKLLLGIFGVAIMFVFTLSIGSGIDPIIDWLSGGGVQTKTSMAGPLVAKWNGGSLNEAELFNLKQNRNLIIQYLYGIQQQASMRGRSPQVAPMPRVTHDESLLELALLDREARKRGIVISDESVLNYLVQLSGGSMQPAEFLELWQIVTGNRGTERQLFSLMRSELAANSLRGLVWSGTRAASPIAHWDFYNRTERKINAELMAIEVADFIDKVPEPTDRELKDYYNLYAARHSVPGSAKPGFRQRRRLAFETVRFDYQEFLDIEQEKVTDQEIEDYYNENKSEFAVTLPEDDLQAPEEAGSSDDSDSDNSTADTATSDSDAGSEATADGEATDAVIESESSEEPAPTPSPAPQETPDSATPETASEVSPSDAEADDAEEGSAMDESQEPEVDVSAATKEEYKPLDEVKDDIRRSIAAPRAQENMQNAIKAVRSRMKKYFDQYVLYEVKSRKDDSLEPPTMPTFDDISDEPPVTVTPIPLSDRHEIGQFELGQALEFEFLQDRILRIPFANIVYEEKTIPLYQPRRFPSADVSPQYVYWVVGQEEANTPAFDDIRDMVADKWKMEKAADMALATANEQANKAREANTSLSESLSLPNAAIFDSGEVSWLTTGNLPMGGGNQPRYSEIPGVDAPSDEMFRSLFRLQPGEVAVAMNETKTAAYVMRSKETTTGTIDRAEQFFSTGLNTPTLYPILRNESQSMLASWYDELKEEYELEWLREPQGGRMRL